MFFCILFLCGGGGGYLVLPWSSLPLPAPLSEEFRWGRCTGQCGCHCLEPCDHHHLSLYLSYWFLRIGKLAFEDVQIIAATEIWGWILNDDYFAFGHSLQPFITPRCVATFGHLVKAALQFWIVTQMLILSQGASDIKGKIYSHYL